MVTMLLDSSLMSPGGLVICCVVLATTAFLLHIQRNRVHRDQSLWAAVHHYLCIKAIYILGYIVRRQLQTSTRNIVETQKSFLLQLLKVNSNTEYGKKYGFGEIQTVQEFRARHPITDYQHYVPYIERMLMGERNILTKEDPVIFGVSSGTSGGNCKTIPTLKRQRLQFFVHAVSVLYCCLIDAFPHIARHLRRSMKIFYNPTKWRMSESGIRIGPNSSTPASLKGLLHMYTTPAAAFEIDTEPDALYIHLLFALKDRELGMIEGNFASIIYNALKTMQREIPHLIQDIAEGKLSEKLNIPSGVRSKLEKLLNPDPDRANEIRQASAEGNVGVCHRLWPHLVAVLTADSGAFTPYGDVLRQTFCKDVPVYSPVYASTEGLLGVNLRPDQLPSRYLLHPGIQFFEFIPISQVGEDLPPLLLHQVELGKEYAVVLTNVSGLCRYQLGDVVRVMDFYNQCPVVEFMYRIGQYLDVRGEKTSESMFYKALSEAVSQWTGVTLVDYCCAESIAVEEAGFTPQDKPCYHLFLELEHTEEEGEVHLSQSQKQMVDCNLCQNSFVYSSFRTKGSIDTIQVHLLRRDAFVELRDFILSSSDASTIQYKVPRVLKKKHLVIFLLERFLELEK